MGKTYKNPVPIWSADPTTHLTCNVCASDIELCECKKKPYKMKNTHTITTQYERANISIEIRWHSEAKEIYFVKNYKGLSYEIFPSAFALEGNTPINAFRSERDCEIFEESKTFTTILTNN